VKKGHRESRRVRPVTTYDLLDTVALRLSDAAEFSAEDYLQKEQTDLGTVRPAFRIPALAQDMLPDDDLILCISIDDRFFKRIHVVTRMPIREFAAADRIIEVPDQILKHVSWADTTVLSCVLVATDSAAIDPSSPVRPGTWLSRKDFRIARPAVARDFPVIKLTEDEFSKRGLPRKTVHHVQFEPDLLLVPGLTVEEVVEVRVAAAVAPHLETQAGEAARVTIMVDVLASLLIEGFAKLGHHKAVPGDSTLEAVARQVGKKLGLQMDDLTALAREDNGRNLRAHLQGAFGLAKAMKASN